MSKNALLVDYEWCSGCHSCEIACRNELGLGHDALVSGVKLLEQGPFEAEGQFMWNYIPSFTNLCDMCAERVEKGSTPSCVLHCLANCLKFGTVEELAADLDAKGSKAFIVLP